MASAALLTAEADADLRRVGRRLADQLALMHHTETRVARRVPRGRRYGVTTVDGVLSAASLDASTKGTEP